MDRTRRILSASLLIAFLVAGAVPGAGYGASLGKTAATLEVELPTVEVPHDHAEHVHALDALVPAEPADAERGAGAYALPACLDEVRHVEHQGPSCRVQGGWRVFLADGTSHLTHGPDPPMPDPVNVQLTPYKPDCVADPANEYHNYAIYAVPTDKANRYASMLQTIRDSISNANGLLREEAAEHGKLMNYEFRCTGNLPTVANATLPTPSGSDSFSTISSDLSAQGYNSNRAKYWVYYDDGVGGFCGQGGIDYDDQPGAGNANNVGPDYAINYGSGCWGYTIAMHESGHNLGAVQLTAPYTSGGWHCNDGLSIMCYADGGSNSSYNPNVCTDKTHFDCRHDNYFHANPAQGNWLYDHWNLGSANNRFLYKHDDCGVGGDAGDSHGAASSVTPPKTDCEGALSDGNANDWFQFHVNSGWIIKLTLKPNSAADFDLCLFKPSDSANSVSCSVAGVGATDSISYTATETGWWRARNYIYSGSGLYKFSVSITQNDCGTNVDAGNSHSAATLIGLPKTNCAASLPATDTQDWYKFQVTSGQVIKLTLVPNANADFDLCLYTPTNSGTSVKCSILGTGQTDTITYTATETGQWRARNYVYSGSGTYTFSACVNC